MIAVANRNPRRSPARRFLRLGDVEIVRREPAVTGRAGTSWTIVRTLVAVAVLAPAVRDTLAVPVRSDAATGVAGEAIEVAALLECAVAVLLSREIEIELLRFAPC